MPALTDQSDIAKNVPSACRWIQPHPVDFGPFTRHRRQDPLSPIVQSPSSGLASGDQTETQRQELISVTVDN